MSTRFGVLEIDSPGCHGWGGPTTNTHHGEGFYRPKSSKFHSLWYSNYEIQPLENSRNSENLDRMIILNLLERCIKDSTWGRRLINPIFKKWEELGYDFEVSKSISIHAPKRQRRRDMSNRPKGTGLISSWGRCVLVLSFWKCDSTKWWLGSSNIQHLYESSNDSMTVACPI